MSLFVLVGLNRIVTHGEDRDTYKIKEITSKELGTINLRSHVRLSPFKRSPTVRPFRIDTLREEIFS